MKNRTYLSFLYGNTVKCVGTTVNSKASFAYVLEKYPLFVYTCPCGAAAKHKGKTNAPKHTQTRCSKTPHTRMTLCTSEGMTKLSETHSSPSSTSSHVSLSLCLACMLRLLAPSALQTHTPARTNGGVSCFSNDETSDQ